MGIPGALQARQKALLDTTVNAATHRRLPFGGHQEPPTFPTAAAELASIADAGQGTGSAPPAQSSLSSFHCSMCSPFAILAMLSIDTLRSERSTPLR